jgi:hypothetical protein
VSILFGGGNDRLTPSLQAAGPNIGKCEKPSFLNIYKQQQLYMNIGDEDLDYVLNNYAVMTELALERDTSVRTILSDVNVMKSLLYLRVVYIQM